MNSWWGCAAIIQREPGHAQALDEIVWGQRREVVRLPGVHTHSRIHAKGWLTTAARVGHMLTQMFSQIERKCTVVLGPARRDPLRCNLLRQVLLKGEHHVRLARPCGTGKQEPYYPAAALEIASLDTEVQGDERKSQQKLQVL